MPDVDEVQRAGWNYTHLCVALVVGVVVQSLVLTCACYRGSLNMKVAFLFDGLIVLRIIVAKLLKQKDKGWIFYAILIYSSPVWMYLLTRIMFGGH